MSKAKKDNGNSCLASISCTKRNFTITVKRKSGIIGTHFPIWKAPNTTSLASFKRNYILSKQPRRNTATRHITRYVRKN